MTDTKMPAPGGSGGRHRGEKIYLKNIIPPRISQSLNRRQAIRKRCLDCSGFTPSEVRNCEFEECFLFPFRSGRGKQNPQERDEAIRQYCLVWCMNDQPIEVRLCPSNSCSLHEYRNTSASRSKKGHIEEKSEGEIQPEGGSMGKKKSGNGYGKMTTIESRLFLSPAFMSLGKRGSSPVVSSCSAQVLILFLGRRQFGKVKRKGKTEHERIDGNRLTLTYKELASVGISQARATRAIDELLAKGFIDIVRQGGAYDKDKSVYALVEDYRFWRPGSPPIRVRSPDVRRGYQGKEVGAAASY